MESPGGSSPARNLTFDVWLLTAVATVTGVLGNLLLSIGMKSGPAGSAAAGVFDYVRGFFQPTVLLAVTLLIVWMVSRMILMSRADLSFILPVTSIGYVFNALVSHFILGEHISPQRWIGTLLIGGGTVLVGLTGPRSEEQRS